MFHSLPPTALHHVACCTHTGLEKAFGTTQAAIDAVASSANATSAFRGPVVCVCVGCVHLPHAFLLVFVVFGAVVQRITLMAR